VLPVVCLLASSAMTNDRRLLAHRTPAWHLRQGDLGYPGSLLSSVDSSAIKRITAGVRACRWSSRQVRSGDWPSPSCTDQCRTKKEQWHDICRLAPAPSISEHWPVFSDQVGAIAGTGEPAVPGPLSESETPRRDRLDAGSNSGKARHPGWSHEARACTTTL
jgi:hypothetical protein